MRNLQKNTLEFRILNAIKSGELDGLVIERVLQDTLVREWDYLDAISCTLSYQEQCKIKNGLYELKMLLTFIRQCNLSCRQDLDRLQ